jgi:DNA-binding MarR family transcriptional regulator
MEDEIFNQAVTGWAAIFLRFSMHDFSHYARNAGLSLLQMNVLMHLYYRGASEAMMVTEWMQVSPAAASQMIERLAQQGLVQRESSPGDRRVRMICLTDQGRRVVAESIAAREEWLKTLSESLTPAEKADVSRMLNLLTEKAAKIAL